MRTLAITVIVMLFVSSVIADVAITAVDLGGQKIQINFTSTGGAVVRGIALNLTITGGYLANSSAYVFGSSSFNTFVDYAFTYAAGYTIGTGHPLANPHAPGVPVFPATEVAISAGYLDQGGTQAGLTSGVVATLQLSGITGNATVAITADTLLRGGPVVGENLGNVTVQSTLNIHDLCSDCLKCTAREYNDWVAFGKPNCWCFRRQCHGDADGLQVAATKTVPAHWVGTPDLTILTSAWKVPTGSITGTMICADFDQTKIAATKTVPEHRVGTPDLTILTNYWKKPDAQNPECPMTNFNFWKN